MSTAYEMALGDILLEIVLLRELIDELQPADEAQFRLERRAEWRALLQAEKSEFIDARHIEDWRAQRVPDFFLAMKEIHEPISAEM